ncbi:MAG: hypothetical protein ACN4GW_03330 [Desulforhopalus sp.]
MKTTYMIFIVVLIITTRAVASDELVLSQQARANIETQTQEMSVLGVPEAKARKMLTLMHQHRFQHQNIIRAQHLVAETATDNLPPEPLIDKAMEGIAKQVPEEQILKAMETVRNRYRHAYRMARNLADDTMTTEDLADTISDCLAAGMDLDDLDTVINRLQVRSRVQTRKRADELSMQTLQTVRTMARLGGGSTDVSQAVCQALDNKYTTDQMEQLQYQFAQQAQEMSASKLAHHYASGSLGKGGSVYGSGNRGDGRPGGRNGSGGSDGSGNSGGNSGSGSSNSSGGSGSSGGSSGSGGSGGSSGSSGSGGSGGSGGSSGSGGGGGGKGGS